MQYFQDPSRALLFILEKHTSGFQNHYNLPSGQKRVYYLMSQRTPQWVATAMEHGPPGEGEVPVRTCSIHGCINGLHHCWGTQGEANKTRAMPDQSGEANPSAKLSRLLVAQLRSVKWRGGYYKSHVAEVLGISMKTLSRLLNGYTWEGIKPYVNASEWAARNEKGDEF